MADSNHIQSDSNCLLYAHTDSKLKNLEYLESLDRLGNFENFENFENLENLELEKSLYFKHFIYFIMLSAFYAILHFKIFYKCIKICNLIASIP